MLLETETDQFLDFAINNSLTLRAFIGDDFFKQLIEMIVQLNEKGLSINVLLLDKIKQHEAAMKTLIHLQKEMIDKYKPVQFVTSDVKLKDL